MEWDKNFGEDLRMASWQSDTTAAAAVLGHFGHLSMTEISGGRLGFELIVHKRIKIFKKSGLSEGNIEIPFYRKNDFEYLKFKRAQTITKSGKKIPVEAKSVFTEKFNENWSVVKFAFPNIEEGCIIEYEYELTSRNLLELHEWYFQEKIPTRASVLKLNIESRLEYSFLFQGENNLSSTKPIYTKDASPQHTIISFYVNNLPALRDEAYISSLENYFTRIRFQLSINYLPSGVKEQILPDWEKTSDKLLDDENMGKRYLKKSQYNKVWEKVKSLINPKDSTEAKIKILYNWVNQNLSWNNNYSCWSQKSGNELLENSKGNSADLNLLLIALLREAGIEANPVILSTRKHEKVYKPFPIIDQYNQVIVHVDKGNNSFILLDAGNVLRPIGTLSVDDLNESGWLLKKKESKWINIVAPMSEKTIVAQITLDEKGDCKGTINNQFKNHDALIERNLLFLSDSKSPNSAFKKKSEWVIDSSQVENLETVDLPLKETVTLHIPNAAQSNGAFIYFKPVLYSNWEVNPFKSPTRTFPIEFPYPSAENYTLSLTLPKGYKIDEMPKAVSSIFQGGEAGFHYAITQTDNKINLRIKIQIRKAVYESKNYEQLKEFFAQIAAKLDEPIVLKKINE
jgi:Domain of Unknown Function with PDB structure (DUF3857)/Transglutaminase-like superfamily/Domain of Unknown Function with PDB structure (DUF3858)